MTLDAQFSTDVSPIGNTGGPLLECLLLIARAHQITSTRETLLAGLPLEAHQLTPSLFSRAAKRAGLKEIILCWQNEKDIEEIDSTFIKGLKFHYVKNMLQVLDIALV